MHDDGHLAAIANWNDGGVATWNTATKQELRDLNVGQAGVARFSPDGRLLATSPDGVRIWRVADGELLHKLTDEKLRRG